MLEWEGDNYLTRDNGCKVMEVSAEREGTAASNILLPNQRALWVIDKKLPQHCILDISNLRKAPKSYNRVAVYCWHQYESNPSLIELAYSSASDRPWQPLATLQLALSSQRQCFSFKEVPASDIKLLKVTILKNYGDPQTYLNQIELGCVKTAPPQKESVAREKTFSDYVKLTSTEKQLKRAQEQIKSLVNEQEVTRVALQQQGAMIIQMQESIKQLTRQVAKLHQIQQAQSQLSPHLEDTLQRDKPKSTHQLNQNHSQNHSHRHSNAKPRRPKLHRSREASDDELSEFEASDDERSKYSDKCTDMMVRLQRLLAERERRQGELRRKGGE